MDWKTLLYHKVVVSAGAGNGTAIDNGNATDSVLGCWVQGFRLKGLRVQDSGYKSSGLGSIYKPDFLLPFPFFFGANDIFTGWCKPHPPTHKQ